MTRISKTLAVALGIYAVWQPFMYAFIFGLSGDSGALPAIAVIACGVILTAKHFKRASLGAFITALSTMSAVSILGLFIHFPDSDSPAPLPYEWLNGYYFYSSPLLLFSLGYCLIDMKTNRPTVPCSWKHTLMTLPFNTPPALAYMETELAC